jgi:redox-sensitive bicupin YhaK (pirin superfamily)
MKMIFIRKSADRGKSQLGWLDSSHTFSFSSYHDPKFMGFSHLRVINEDIVQPDNGFGRHSHSDMEIISYVIDGSLEHKDSMGTGSTIRPGEIQRMSAGSGVEHSEFNHSKTDPLHFLQIWVLPEEKNLPPSYEQKKIVSKSNELILIGSKRGGENVITIHQDVELYVAYMLDDHSLSYEFKEDRQGWLQMVTGTIEVNGKKLSAGDGAAIIEDRYITIKCLECAEFLLFDLS